MAEEEVKKVGAPAPVQAKSDVADDKVMVPAPPAPFEEKDKEKVAAAADETKALAIVEKPESAPKKISSGSIDRDITLADLEKEKRLSFIRAWEDNEKSKAENKSHKKLSAVAAWENSKKAVLEAQLRKIQEKLEKKKGEYAEHMKNRIALIHKQAEEKRATVEARRGEEILKAEETAAKCRATGKTPKKLLGCF